MQNTVHPDMVLDDVEEVLDEPNFNNPNTSPDPPSPYADLEKKFRKNKFNKKKNYYPELFGTQGVEQSEAQKVTGNKVRKKKAAKTKRKPTSKNKRYSQKKGQNRNA